MITFSFIQQGLHWASLMDQTPLRALKSKAWDGPCPLGAYCPWCLSSQASQQSHVQHYPEFWPELMDHQLKGLEMDTLLIPEFQIIEKLGNLNGHPDQLAIFQKQNQKRCSTKPLEVKSYPKKSVVSRAGNSGSNTTV